MEWIKLIWSTALFQGYGGCKILKWILIERHIFFGFIIILVCALLSHVLSNQLKTIGNFPRTPLSAAAILYLKVSLVFSRSSSWSTVPVICFKMTHDTELQDEISGKPRLRLSLFPNVPPYHVFLPPWKSYNCTICPALKEEEWQFPAQIMPIVRDVVAHAGFKITKVGAIFLRHP